MLFRGLAQLVLVRRKKAALAQHVPTFLCCLRPLARCCSASAYWLPACIETSLQSYAHQSTLTAPCSPKCPHSTACTSWTWRAAGGITVWPWPWPGPSSFSTSSSPLGKSRWCLVKLKFHHVVQGREATGSGLGCSGLAVLELKQLLHQVQLSA